MKTETPAPVAQALRSLLVEDDSAVQREHAVHLARGLGVTDIHEAGDGAIALALLDRLASEGSSPHAPPIDSMPLAQAIAAGRIFPHFQPKVDVRTGLPRGVEVLARWHDPELGNIPPDGFIAAAERHGLIQPPTMAIRDQSLAQAARWRSRGLELSIASVAEGVETMDDWALLQRLGCNLAQGWLIAKAMPGDDIPGWLRQHAQRLPTLRPPISQGA